MRRATFLLLLFSFVMFGFAPPEEPVDWQAVQRIRQEGLQNSQVMDILSYLTDVYGPRLTNSPNYMKAAQWALDKFNEWGLENAHLEPWGTFGRGWALKKLSVEMLEPQYQPLIAYPKAWTPGTNGVISGEPVLLEIESEKDLQKYKGQLQGKIVMVRAARDMELKFEPEAKRHDEESLAELAEAPEPGKRSPYYARRQEWLRRRMLQRKIQKLLREEGAAVLIEPSSRNYGIVRAHSGGSYRMNGDNGLPALVMAVEHYNRIARLLKKNIPVKLAIQIETQFFEDDSLGYNIIAEIPGTDKKLRKQIVMLGAHFDSWHAGTGATDNASGSAVVMEAVRILKAIGVKPRRTIRVALWGGEEQGLLGSRGYVKKHFADRETMELKPEHKLLSAYFNLDNGTGRIRGVYLQGNDAVRPIFEAWLRPFHDLGATTVTIRNTGGTDHLSFDAVGLPGFQFIQDPIDYFTRTHHTNMDVYDHALKGDLMQASVIMAAFVYHAAMRDEMLPRKPLPKPRKSGHLTSR